MKMFSITIYYGEATLTLPMYWFFISDNSWKMYAMRIHAMPANFHKS